MREFPLLDIAKRFLFEQNMLYGKQQSKKKTYIKGVVDFRFLKGKLFYENRMYRNGKISGRLNIFEGQIE